ncbi:MAG: hypothetical protein HY744_29410 [Deltaproteobacteria bacterium]|nr:hypothetical protein [Deltaproteobacteria bacterium]
MELPGEPRLRWILARLARLLALGAEPVAGLVLPTAEFFPDDFDGRAPSVARLLGRVARHAGFADVPLRLAVPGAPGAAGSCACGSGGCGEGGGAPAASAARVERLGGPDGGYLVPLAAAQAGHPAALTTALVRAVAEVFLHEAQAEEELDPGEQQALCELCGTMLGFGVLLCNGAYIYTKGCGGARIGSATVLPVEELSVALAVFCQLHRSPWRAAAAHLEPTARACFGPARDWAIANAGVVQLLRSDRRAIEAGTYALGAGSGWLGRLLGLGRARGPSVPTEAELAALGRSFSVARARLRPRAGEFGRAPDPRPRDGAKERRLSEIRALVDESLER